MNFSALISENLKNQLERIRDFCITHDETIATAESVTSGAIQFMLSTTLEAQQFYQGGITTYNVAQKSIHLSVDPVYAENTKGVSSRLSTQMATAACTLFRAQIGVGITGFANPVPEEDVNEVFAHVSIIRNGNLLISEKLVPLHEGTAAQWQFAEDSIALLAAILSETNS